MQNKLEIQVHTLQKTQLKVMDVAAHNTQSAFRIVLIRNLQRTNVISIVFSSVSDQQINSYHKWGDKVAQSHGLFFFFK